MKRRVQEKYKFGFKLNTKVLASMVLGLFVVFYLFLTLQTVSSGTKLDSLEKTEQDLAKQNKDLTLQLVEASSLTKLSQKAQDLGFGKPQLTVYLTQEDAVAKLP
jgi:cell division protein FtsL